MNVVSDAEEHAIAKARKGDLAAFNLLVERYQHLVYNVALRTLGHPQDAEDATQDTFLAAFRRLHDFRGGSFRGWLLRIAVNTCYDVLRRRQRRPAQSLDRLLDDPDHPVDIPDPDPAPEAVVLGKEAQHLIASSLQLLPPEQRVVVVLADVQGLSYEEIATATGTSLGTVKSRLSRGRAHLRDILSRHEELFDLIQRLHNEGTSGESPPRDDR
ncbi:MAG TPA: sigma-70 family RNA polymerase sigma factor [Chloroflexota bacterium]